MPQKTVWLNIFLSIFPIFFLFINILDIIGVLQGQHDYPFGSDFFSWYSIYRSRYFYIGFVTVSAGFLVITLYLIWKEKWVWLLIFMLIDTAFFFYPILTMEE